MNKLSYTTILAAAFLLLPGCSDDAAIDNGMMEESPEVLVGDSEVEIKLSSNSSPLTRNGGLYEHDGTFSTIGWKRLGVFCLASGKQLEEDAPAYVTDPDWNNKDDANKSDVVLWNHTAAVNSGNVIFMSNDTPIARYYPATNWYRYDFYAFHINNKELATPVLSEDGKQITVKKDIDGREDVIWGKMGLSQMTEQEKAAMVYTENGNSENYSKYAYSARFFRRQVAATGVNTTPALKLKHILSRFKFTVVVGDEAARGMKVSGIALLDMPHKFNMVLANNTYGLEGDELTAALAEEGTIPLANIDMTEKQDFWLTGHRITINEETAETDEQYAWDVNLIIPADAPVNAEYAFKSEETGFSELASGLRAEYVEPCIMAIPGLPEYTLRIRLTAADGSSLICDQRLPFGTPEGWMGSDAVPAKPGYSYNVKIKVYGPQSIGIQAELEDWIDYTDDGITIELN